MKILAILACLLPLHGCIFIPVAAMLVAKMAFEARKQHQCERAEGRC
jgi:hypothetical protein